MEPAAPTLQSNAPLIAALFAPDDSGRAPAGRDKYAQKLAAASVSLWAVARAAERNPAVWSALAAAKMTPDWRSRVERTLAQLVRGAAWRVWLDAKGGCKGYWEPLPERDCVALESAFAAEGTAARVRVQARGAHYLVKYVSGEWDGGERESWVQARRVSNTSERLSLLRTLTRFRARARACPRPHLRPRPRPRRALPPTFLSHSCRKRRRVTSPLPYPNPNPNPHLSLTRRCARTRPAGW